MRLLPFWGAALLIGLCQHKALAAMTPERFDVEEQRYAQAAKQLPEVAIRYQAQTEALLTRYRANTNELSVTRNVAQDGTALWQAAVKDVQQGGWDDRPLYWNRLATRIGLKQQQPSFTLAAWQRQILLNSLEKASRGMSDVHFLEEVDLRILLTGFDPFLLDRNLSQSNPSGLAALAFDGVIWPLAGKRVQIESVLIPVRFQDFDDGLIESLLTPYLRDNNIDMVVTVSMGREHFDLERFAGRNRSAAMVDNQNFRSGATPQQPKPPYLNGQVLNGPEFVEFSLPAQAMQQAIGRYQVNDNRQVETELGTRQAGQIEQLDGAVSVAGSGGGYLSNEISYRSLLLKQLLGSQVLVGHIHTPKIDGHDPSAQQQMVEQLQAILQQAASTQL
ncbi:MAG: hypothetical protein R3Y10_00810 [Ferrimonas sp.]